MTSLNEIQRKFVYNKIKDSVIIGLPGSGKTRTIVEKCKQLLKDPKFPKTKNTWIKIMMFQRAISDELKSRLSHDYPLLANGVSTFHSFAGLLKRNLLRKPYGIQHSKFIRKIGISTLIFNITEYLKKCKNRKDLMIYGMSGIASIKYLFIDEAQDLDDCKMSFINEIKRLSKCVLVFAGDPNQAIYTFAGGNSRYFKDMCTNNNYDIYKLNINYRSTRTIIKSLNSIIPYYLISGQMKPGREEIGSVPNVVFVDNVQEALDDMILKIFEILRKETGYFIYTVKQFHHILSLRRKRIMYVLKSIAILSSSKESDKKRTGKSTTLAVNAALIYLRQLKIPYKKCFDLIDGNSNNYTTNNNNQNNIDIDIYKYKPFINRIGKECICEIRITQELEENHETQGNSGINLYSIHKAKGLEFNHVIILGGGNNLMDRPYSSKKDYYDHLCLWYVAVSRARNTVSIYAFGHKRIWSGIMRLLHSNLITRKGRMSVRNEQELLNISNGTYHVNSTKCGQLYTTKSITKIINDQTIFTSALKGKFEKTLLEYTEYNCVTSMNNIEFNLSGYTKLECTL